MHAPAQKKNIHRTAPHSHTRKRNVLIHNNNKKMHTPAPICHEITKEKCTLQHQYARAWWWCARVLIIHTSGMHAPVPKQNTSTSTKNTLTSTTLTHQKKKERSSHRTRKKNVRIHKKKNVRISHEKKSTLQHQYARMCVRVL